MDVTGPLHSYGDVKSYVYDAPEPLYDVKAGAAEQLSYSWRKGKARNAESVLY